MEGQGLPEKDGRSHLREAGDIGPLEVVLRVLERRRRARHDEGVVAEERGQVRGDGAVGGKGEGEVEVVARVTEAKGLARLEGAVDGDEIVVVVARVDARLVEDVA